MEGTWLLTESGSPPGGHKCNEQNSLRSPEVKRGREESGLGLIREHVNKDCRILGLEGNDK